MPKKPNDSAGAWRFSYSVLMPTFLAAVATVATVGAFAVWATSRNDTEALNRQITLVSHVLEDQRHLVTKEQEDVAAWQNAEKAVVGHLDMNFIDENLGIGMFDFFGHDRTYVLDPRMNAVYAMRSGGSADPGIYESVRTTIEPLARRLREINWQGALSAFATGVSDKVPSITDIIVLEGQPAIVSLMPIVSDEGESLIAPGGEYVHVTAEFLDAALAEELTDLLLLDGARFGVDAKAREGETSIAIRNNAGVPTAYFFWQPNRPGARVVAEIAPAVAGAALIASLIIAVLVLQLRRSTAALVNSRAEAHHKAYHDVLTGLGNRVQFEDKLEQAIARLDGSGEEKVALLLLDLDRFKQVNDTLGHEAGDELIRQVADRMRPLVRSTDTLARLGGDEFVIIAERITSEDDISALCERLVTNIRKPFDLRSGQAFVGVSIGVAVATTPDIGGSELTRMADIALYGAKDGGRNQYRIFENHMQEIVRERQALESDLRAALRTDDQLDVKFSPLVREDGTEVIGVSASIHWFHPQRGSMEPEDFMPLAESCGLVDLIGEFVLHRACQVGAKTPGQMMAVRAYAAQLRNPYFFDKVFSILHETGMRPSDLELEVGEKMLSLSEEAASATLRKLRHAGVRIALNDFGTGFTSLRLLQQFQVDRIKIDKHFIKELEQSPDPEAITHAVVWLARAVGVEVSADGVDTPEKKEFLARMGCASFQGDLFTPEGQAGWLRVAANLESNVNNTEKPEQSEDLKEIELWDDTGS